jgi:catechol 2,3-dioxygenase-like lactoylglutathione lyase family enzyme
VTDWEPRSGAVTGTAEIALNVRDLPRMRRFYEEVLGFPLLYQGCHEHGPEADPAGEPTIAFLTIAELDTPLGCHGHPQILALIDYRRHAFARGRFDRHERSASTLNHLAFEIPPERYEAEQARLAARGLEPDARPLPGIPARSLFFDDPEGNQIELICHNPGA